MSRMSESSNKRSKQKQSARISAGRLTPAQEEYCRLRASGATQDGAYFDAFPRSKNWTLQTRRARAWELEHESSVRSRIDEIRAVAERESEVSVARLQRELAHIALFDIRCLIDDESGALKKITELDEATARALSGIDIVHVGNNEVGVGAILKFKTNSKILAITELLKLRGAYEKDNRQLGKAQGEAIAAGVAGFLTGLSSSGACGLPMAAPRQNTPEG